MPVASAFNTDLSALLGKQQEFRQMPPARQRALVDGIVALHENHKPPVAGPSTGSGRGVAGAAQAYQGAHDDLTGALENECGIAPNWRAKTNMEMLATLRARGADYEKVHKFMVFWNTTWRAKGGPPRLADVLEFWPAAMAYKNGSSGSTAGTEQEKETRDFLEELPF